jgi:hypothetical protein
MATTIVQDIERKHRRPRGILGRKRASANLRGHRALYGSNPYPVGIRVLRLSSLTLRRLDDELKDDRSYTLLGT